MAAYVREGERTAYELGNRGPIKFNSDGTLHKTSQMPTGVAGSTCSRGL